MLPSDWQRICRHYCQPVLLYIMGLWLVLLLGVFLVLNLAAGSSTKDDLGSLRFVQIIFRHGKRTPVQYFQHDSNNPLWGGVIGKLTLEGKQDAYALGEWFRKRYNGFLSEFVSDNEMSIKSTSIHRTLETAQLFAAGVYPPQQKEIWNGDLGTKWQPFPIYSLNLYSERAGCTRFDQIQKMLESTPEENRIYTAHKKLINHMLKELGEKQGRRTGFFHAFDILMIEKVQNLTYPDWIAEDIPEAELLRDFYSKKIIKTPELTRLSIGDFFKQLMHELKDVTNNKKGSQKVSVYSAHDTTLIPIMASMNMFNYIWPPFSSALILELYQNNKEEYLLKVLYRNDTAHDPFVFNFPNCSEMCPWQQVWEQASHYFLDDKEAACTGMTPEEMFDKQRELNNTFP